MDGPLLCYCYCLSSTLSSITPFSCTELNSGYQSTGKACPWSSWNIPRQCRIVAGKNPRHFLACCGTFLPFLYKHVWGPCAATYMFGPFLLSSKIGKSHDMADHVQGKQRNTTREIMNRRKGSVAFHWKLESTFVLKDNRFLISF